MATVLGDNPSRRATDYAAVGCDELIFFPCTNQLDQIPLLATAAKL